MAEFLSELDVRECDDGTWLLLDSLIYQSDLIGKVIVPKGFITDMASIPRIPGVYAATKGIARKAAVVHDFLYHMKKVNRDVADAVFLEAMGVIGVGWRKYPMYWAVRLFGGSHYNRRDL